METKYKIEMKILKCRYVSLKSEKACLWFVWKHILFLITSSKVEICFFFIAGKKEKKMTSYFFFIKNSFVFYSSKNRTLFFSLNLCAEKKSVCLFYFFKFRFLIFFLYLIRIAQVFPPNRKKTTKQFKIQILRPQNIHFLFFGEDPKCLFLKIFLSDSPQYFFCFS